MNAEQLSLLIAKALEEEFIIRTCNSRGEDSPTLQEIAKVVEAVLSINDYQI